MEINKIISADQLMCVLFSSAMLLPFSANRAMLLGQSGINISICSLICPLLLILLMLPAYSAKSAVVNSKALNFFYLFYFLFMGVYNLSVFLVFISNVISPDISESFIALGVCAVSVYAAIKGIETTARSSAVIMFIIALAAAVISFSAAFEVKSENLRISPIYASQIAQGAFSFFSRTYIIPAAIFLFDFANERPHKKFILYSFSTFILLFFLILFSVGALGRYFYTQLFPVYRLSEIISIGPFTKAEIFFLGVFLLGLTANLSAVLLVSHKCFSALPHKREKYRVIILFAGVISAFSVLVSSSVKLQHIVFSQQLLGVLAAVFSAVVPLAAYVFRNGTNKKAIALILPFLLLLSGCSEAKLQDNMMVSGMYLEKRNDIYTVGIIASHSEENLYYEAFGESIKKAIDKIEENSGKKPVFSHDMLIFLEGGTAKEKTKELLDFFLRYYEIIPSSKFIYLNLNEDELRENTGELMKKANDFIGSDGAKRTDIIELTNAFLDKNGDFALPVLEKSGEEFKTSRIAIFREGKLHTLLDENMAGTYLLLTGEAKSASFIIDDANAGKITLALRNIRVEKGKNETVISLSADISECEKGLDILMGMEHYSRLEEKLNSLLCKEIQAVLKNTACEETNIKIISNVNRMEEEANPLF